MDNSDFAKKRLEKDLQELKKLIEAHFKLRANDELELEALKGRIDKRRVVRTFNLLDSMDYFDEIYFFIKS